MLYGILNDHDNSEGSTMWDDYDSDYDFEGTGSGDSYDSETYSSYGKNEERSKHNGMTFQRGYNIFFTAMAMLYGVPWGTKSKRSFPTLL